jgi:hypothetical protein
MTKIKQTRLWAWRCKVLQQAGQGSEARLRRLPLLNFTALKSDRSVDAIQLVEDVG